MQRLRHQIYLSRQCRYQVLGIALYHYDERYL
jgi:hypothetical protein